MFVEGSVDLRPFVHQLAKKFLSTYYSFSFNSVHPPWLEALNAVGPLPSSQLFPADFSFPQFFFFQFPGMRLIADFIAT